MVASVQTSKLFNGKIYAKSKPNSCVSDVKNSLDFEISMPYHDLMCDVKQENPGTFKNDIIIQHHDMIVTTLDKGLSVHCNYDLSNRSISNAPLDVADDVGTREDWMNNVHSATVAAPNVTMKITNQQGYEIESANVGDSLSLRFEVLEKSSPYEIFVRELVAVDGVDTSEILLIDSSGCPTDASIMGPMGRVDGSGQILSAIFDAFKFPTSDVVQFRALVTPCLPNCEPVQCEVNGQDGSGGRSGDTLSYGKRRRRSLLSSSSSSSSSETKLADEEEMVVVQTIKIVDTFNNNNKNNDRKKQGNKKGGVKGLPSSANGKIKPSDDITGDLLDLSDDGINNNNLMESVTFDSEKRVNRRNIDSSGCASFLGLILACSLFLIVQLFLILAWCLLWYKKQKKGFSSSSSTTLTSSPYYHHNTHHSSYHSGVGGGSGKSTSSSSCSPTNKLLSSATRSGSIGGHSILSNSSSSSLSSSVANHHHHQQQQHHSHSSHHHNNHKSQPSNQHTNKSTTSSPLPPTSKTMIRSSSPPSSYGQTSASYLTPFSSYHRKFAEPRKTSIDMYSSMSQLYQ